MLAVARAADSGALQLTGFAGVISSDGCQLWLAQVQFLARRLREWPHRDEYRAQARRQCRERLVSLANRRLLQRRNRDRCSEHPREQDDTGHEDIEPALRHDRHQREERCCGSERQRYTDCVSEDGALVKSPGLRLANKLLGERIEGNPTSDVYDRAKRSSDHSAQRNSNP